MGRDTSLLSSGKERGKIEEERGEALEKAWDESQEFINQTYARIEEIKEQASREADQISANNRKFVWEGQERIFIGMREKVIPLAIAAAKN